MRKTTTNGRFCNQCQKNVVDFTKFPLVQIKEQLAKGQTLCGIFKIEDIAPEIVMPLEVPLVNRFFAYLISFILVFSLKESIAQANYATKTEKIEKSNLEEFNTITLEDNHQFNASFSASEQKNTKNESKKYSKWYLSKRFPFIIKRKKKYIIRGVCPSF